LFWSYYSAEGNDRVVVAFFVTTSLFFFCCSAEGDNSNIAIAFWFGLAVAEKAMVELQKVAVTFYFHFVAT
jgi:hypothetical protein